MAELKPFCAWRFAADKVDIGKVVAPPYDVISESYQDELYKRNEFNVVRLILGKQDAKDTSSDNRYTRAKQYLAEWIKKEILKQDNAPSFYLYHQSYTHPESGKKIDRTAFFSLLRLEEFGNNVVFPHEKTHFHPKVDRLNLIKEVEANLSPVFGLYDDEDQSISKILKESVSSDPLYELTDDQDVHHTLWAISDSDKVNSIVEAFQGKSIFIADGHHRYETALNYSHFLEAEQAPSELRIASDYLLVALVDFHDPGLLIFPTHRIVKQIPNFDKENFLKSLHEYFEVHNVAKDKIVGELGKADKAVKVIGLYFGGEDGYILKLKNEKKLLSVAPEGKSNTWSGLDVSFISYLILVHLLSIKESEIEGVLTYTRSSQEALKVVDKGNALMSFLLRPISTKEVRKVCEAGELMPQKSTYFYPKLLSGLVIRKFVE